MTHLTLLPLAVTLASLAWEKYQDLRTDKYHAGDFHISVLLPFETFHLRACPLSVLKCVKCFHCRPFFAALVQHRETKAFMVFSRMAVLL